MKHVFLPVLLVAGVVAGVPAVAGPVVASEGVTLTEAAQAKFNADTRQDDRHVVPVAGTGSPSGQFYRSAGLTVPEGRSMSLEQVFVAKINRESGRDGEQRVETPSAVTVASRAFGAGSDNGQLAASARLDPASASSMSLAEVAAAKFAAEGNYD